MINCGTTASAGCVRLTVSDAYWIYNNVASGTYVEFYSSSDPGPLGKPYAQKISSNEECRNWDPTDFSEGNPWRNYKAEEVIEEREIEEEKKEKPEENIVVDVNENNNKNSNENITPEEKTNDKEETVDNTENIIENNVENQTTSENLN